MLVQRARSREPCKGLAYYKNQIQKPVNSPETTSRWQSFLCHQYQTIKATRCSEIIDPNGVISQGNLKIACGYSEMLVPAESLEPVESLENVRPFNRGEIAPENLRVGRSARSVGRAARNTSKVQITSKSSPDP
jgi:hypothetical protein